MISGLNDLTFWLTNDWVGGRPDTLPCAYSGEADQS